MIATTRLRVTLLASTLTTIPLAAPAAAQRATPTDSTALIALGAQIYSRNCQRCHNPRSPAERTDREWVIIVQHMQIRANLSADRAAAVRAFLLASNGPAQAPGRVRATAAPAPAEASVTAAMIQQGREIFHGAGGCLACHGDHLQGGPIAPNLADGTWKNGNGSLAAILRIIRNGVQGTAMVAYPGGITDEEAVQVAAYVWAVAHGRAKP